MKLARFSTPQHPQPRLGALLGGHVVDLSAAAEAYPSAAPAPEAVTDTSTFLAAGSAARQAADELCHVVVEEYSAGTLRTNADGCPTRLSAEHVRLHAPVRPRRLRDYLTYPQHAAGAGMDVPDALRAMPICYQGNHDALLGPEETIPWPAYTCQLDYELELALVVGTGGRDLSAHQAAEHIAGFVLFNDVSARDIQALEMRLGIGPSKGKDFANVLGPVVLTADEIDNEDAITLTARVNGETWSTGDTSGRQHSCADVVAWASYQEELYPGEVLAIGTPPGGCGLELDRWIQPGDVIELEASGIGTLRNPVGHPATPPEGAGLATYTGAPRVSLH